MTINRLRALVQDDLNAVNDWVISKINIHTGIIDDLASHTIQSGGKRLRPLVVLLSSHACGYTGKQHIELAAMIEFFHTATLLHDDVIDESGMRRGKETANAIWGDKVSILVGDYLLSQYMQIMVDIGNLDIMRLLTDISIKIGCGELKQLENRHNFSLSESEYFEVISAKTSLLFAASACLGALITDSPKTTQDAFYQYGLRLGNAFQLIDDALDYCADAQTIGKNIGDDLAYGIPTLPLLHALKHSPIDKQERIKQSLKVGTLDDFPMILSAIEDTKAIDYTKQVANQEIRFAISALDNIPDSNYKDALIELAHYAVTRDH